MSLSATTASASISTESQGWWSHLPTMGTVAALLATAPASGGMASNLDFTVQVQAAPEWQAGADIMHHDVAAGTGAQSEIEEVSSMQMQSHTLTDFIEAAPVVAQPAPDLPGSLWASMTDREQWVIQGILSVIAEESQRQFVRSDAIVISRFLDPEDGSEEFVIEQHVPLPRRAADLYWDSLGWAINRWTKGLPRALRDVALERVSVSVEWDSNVGSI